MALVEGPLLAQMRSADRIEQCPLSGVSACIVDLMRSSLRGFALLTRSHRFGAES
jgi:hypothetical protein